MKIKCLLKGLEVEEIWNYNYHIDNFRTGNQSRIDNNSQTGNQSRIDNNSQTVNQSPTDNSNWIYNQSPTYNTSPSDKTNQPDNDLEISGIAYDSRKVTNGNIFVCIDGTKTDGHKYIPDAIKNGATAFLVQRDLNEIPLSDSKNPLVIKVKDTRFGLAAISANFYSHPSRAFNLTGVTGTKGKTTTTHLIKAIYEKEGLKTGLTGTVGNYIGSKKLYATRTTPEALDLQVLFDNMKDEGVERVVMEVSSQGLKLHRVACCDFDTAVFTNISRDHIGPGEHTDFDDYLKSKALLFSMCKNGLVNIDNNYSEYILKNATCSTLTFGLEKQADINAYDINMNPDGTVFNIKSPWGNESVKLGMPGRFNVYNALAAIGSCCINGVSLSIAASSLAAVKVPGRIEKVWSDRFTVLVDYAHTPDSLENILSTVKQFKRGRLISVFGCGGDRDRGKRPQMGVLSGKLADFSIITSDNPRTENPETILDDIEAGIRTVTSSYKRIADREEAIFTSVNMAEDDDVIVIAGKGHENYQEFADRTIHFDDRETALKCVHKVLNLP